MNRNIAWLEKARDEALHNAELWHDAGVAMGEDIETGVYDISKEMKEVRSWLKDATRFDKMIKRLRGSAIPSPPPTRRRSLQMDEKDGG